MKPKIYITRPLPDFAFEAIQSACDVRHWDSDVPAPVETLWAEVANIEGLVCYGKGFPLHDLCDRVDRALLERAPKLTTVAIYGDGVDNVDVPECTARGITVSYTPSDLTDTVADFTFALLLSLARRIPEGMQYIREDRWKAWCLSLEGRDVHRATLGLVGLGRIAAAVARRAMGFDMRVIYYDVVRRPEVEAALGLTYQALEQVLSESDFVSLHVPFTPDTQGMIGEEALRRMKPTAMLINTARGNIIDGAALARALQQGVIAGAALDVTDPEPLAGDHPLAHMPNAIVTPHIAAETGKKTVEQGQLIIENLLAGLRGATPAHLLNPEVLESPARRLPERPSG